jgi:hypothetical protein
MLNIQLFNLRIAFKDRFITFVDYKKYVYTL